MRKVNDTNEEYHSSDLIGTSSIVAGYDSKSGEVNLAEVKAHLDGMKEISKQRQRIFDFGSVQHSVVLEQDLSQVKVVPVFESIPVITKKEQVEAWQAENPFPEMPEIPAFEAIPKITVSQQKEWWIADHLDADLSTMPKFSPIAGISIKAQKDAWLLENPMPDVPKMPKFEPIPGTSAKQLVEEWKEKNPATYYITETEYKSVCGAFEVIADNAAAAQMISNALEIETSFYDDEEGLKTRPDIVGETDNGGLFVCNYKTIADLSKIHSHMYHLKYDIRAIQEILLIEKAMARKVQHYFFLFQSKQPPYSVKCIEMSELDLEFGYSEYKKIKNMVKLAIDNDYFPQPPFTIEQSKVYRSPQIDSF